MTDPAQVEALYITEVSNSNCSTDLMWT